jgi:hypothetical protein
VRQPRSNGRPATSPLRDVLNALEPAHAQAPIYGIVLPVVVA